jgi:hypothetical protein
MPPVTGDNAGAFPDGLYWLCGLCLIMFVAILIRKYRGPDRT